MSKGKSQPFHQDPPPQKSSSVGGGVESFFREDQVQMAELHQKAVFPERF